ncbi:MAG: glycoside hydrolase family 92 protein, partial [Bacteroidia bacterium]|nr:glycoside hydrolase family 92 protein [Bacteroidia bacterium]
RVHRVMTEFYNDQPDGLIGNEDCGQMSAWYVLSALGFYPVSPGSNTYQTGTPLFSKARVALANNKTLTILAENLSEDNYYVKNISFGSEKSYPMTLFHATKKSNNQLIKGINEGGELRFIMTDKPESVRQWGASSQKMPSFLLISGDKKTFRDSLKISITDGFGESTEGLYYTIDGSNPSTRSIPYTKPFYIYNTCTIKAASFGKQKTAPTEAQFFKVNAEFHVSLQNCKPNSQYYADGEQSLIDGVRGDKNWRLGDWMGFQGQDVEIVVDLGKLRKINAISLGCLQDFGSWISMPKEVIFEIAKDGGEFEVVGSVKNDVSDKETENIIKDFRLPLDKYGRRIRITAKNYGLLPSWHPGAGGETFIFVDEVGVE